MSVRVYHVITTLSTGGAEMMLLRLLRNLDRRTFTPEVVVLAPSGPVGDRIVESGVRVRSLGMQPGRPDPRAVLRLARWMRADRPAVVQTWMYHADLIGGMAAQLAGRPAVVWGIHNSRLEPQGSKRATRAIVSVLSVLSRVVPDRIVCCAEAARRVHVERGYDERRMLVIPNGFNLAEFRPDPDARSSLRNELGVSSDTLLVGCVARSHPDKDHGNLIAAAALVLNTAPHVRFVLCGEGVTWENEVLAGLIRELGVESNFYLLGRRADMSRIVPGLDVLCSSSAAEAFPLAVGEAMACGVPCVVTDVGDSALLVADTGIPVPPRDPPALAVALLSMLGMPAEDRAALGRAARERIGEHYAIEAITHRYERLYLELGSRGLACAA